MKKGKGEDKYCLNTIGKKYFGKWLKTFMAWGRTWGLIKDGTNPYFGTHFTIIDGDEVVILVQKRTPWGFRDIDMYQFKKTDKTELGEKVIEKFKTIGHQDQLRLR